MMTVARLKVIQEGSVRKRVLALLVFASVAAGAAWAADNPFLGTWKLNSSLSRMPDEMKIEGKGNNTYSFDFGGGVGETIVADGTDQPGRGGTTLSVKPDGPDWIVVRKKDGRMLIRATWKLSPDGSTLTDLYRQFESDGSTTSMDYVYQRNGGGSGFAGDWQSIKETMNSPFILEVKEYEGDGLSLTDPVEHDTKNMKLDGNDYPQGPHSSSSLRRVDDHTLEMTEKGNGKVYVTREIKLSRDGKQLTMTLHQPGLSKVDVMVFDRE